VGQNIKIEEAQVARQSILGYAPADRGAQQYRELALELAKRMKIPEVGDGQATVE
jgi:cellulose biosynthesis protein BcsQ